jgi:hypothetical protein
VHSRAVVAFACVIALAVGACGDDGGDAGPPLTKAELIEQGDAICRAFDRRVDEATAGLADDASREDVVDVIRDQLVPLQEALVDELDELVPPPADEATYEGVLDDLRSGIRSIRDDPERFVDGRLDAEALDRADDGLRQYGFEACGRRGGVSP